jgi:hypothetical protein
MTEMLHVLCALQVGKQFRSGTVMKICTESTQ